MIESIQLDKNSDKYLYQQLYSQLKNLILTGELEVDTKLPPIRKLAQQLSVNNVTIVNAYDLLDEEDLVYKKVGSGTFVAPVNTEVNSQRKSELDEQVYIDEDTKFVQQEEIINFATGAPTPDLFPIAPFKRLMNKVLERDRGYAFGYQKSQGYYPLRKTIAEYVTQYGIETKAEEVQIVSGAQQGIDILAKTFLDYGDTVFVERPTYPGAISVFESRRANIVEIPMTPQGIDVEIMEEKLQEYQPSFLYLMPNFQNPTGYSYSKTKKEKVLKLAGKYDLKIIEDDCLNDLNYSQQRSLTLKELDSNNQVIYLKSFSKVFMPGLRLAFLLVPKVDYEDILMSKYLSDIFTDGLVQRVLELYFKEEVWEEQIEKLKQTYHQRYQTMIQALEDYCPSNVNYNHLQGGLNFWLELPTDINDQKLQKLALEQGINIAPGTVFYISNPPSNKLRLSIAAVDEKEITKGIKKLSQIIKKLLKDKDYALDKSIFPIV
ncbi:PLP-dependent aminotransferase family protein [Halanaerobacter jeridensis]|uniref:DNA-binding transcriptional MocR family regulator n=1 Tax=Halanaerobacter jeridensis TaxID=706427 RepID=A0A938XSF2_9FIRM|nr:PLP-dependent aminotransferase family protein [Halanaerobacter jeridensis]MBM7555446.1 DNA-binding transcriptional MocR family regulator [Halanaerobacter jeridensis]